MRARSERRGGGGAANRRKRGNLIAAALGAVLARPESKLLLLQEVNEEILKKAQTLIDGGRSRIACDSAFADFRIDVRVAGAQHAGRCVLAGGHTNIERIEKDGQPVFRADQTAAADGLAYREALGRMTMAEILAIADTLDADDRAYLRRGVEMNLAMSEWGFEVRGTAFQLRQMQRDGYLADDLFFRAKNPHRLGRRCPHDRHEPGGDDLGRIGEPRRRRRPHAVHRGPRDGGRGRPDYQEHRRRHLVNAYIKCFLGEVSVICGCAMAAGIASATAIVYQQRGIDIPRITLAVGNVIGDLGGLICDGAKPGCAMKAITSVDSAIRSALMALKGYGPGVDDGLVGKTVEDSLRNLGQITFEGMFRVDSTMLSIIKEKVAPRCRA